MKNFVKRLLALAVTCAMLSVCALAADFTGCADELHTLGLFQGTGAGADGNPEYKLDAAPTRAEAITMLVRLLGKEAEAQEGTWEVPFTDLGGANVWALPYVGYAYANGLTNGVSDTLFGTNETCSGQMYCALVLRALGYDDAAGDFAYNDALAFAVEKGLLDSLLASGEFLRDEIAAVSYAALATPLNGSEVLLVEKLVEEGAVDAALAQPFIDKAALYAEYCALNEQAGADMTSIDMTMNMDMTMSTADVTVPMAIEANEKIRLLEDSVEMAAVMTVSAMGQTQTVETYVTDGVMYTTDGSSKVKAPYTALDDAMGLASLTSASSSPLYAVQSISKAEADGVTTYTLNMGGSLLTSMTETVMGMTGQAQDLSGMTMGDCAVSVSFEGGAMTGLTMSLPMSMTSDGQTISFDVSVDAVINAVGSDVVIEFPADLDTYVDMPAE